MGLTLAVRYFGIALALIGTFAAAPGVTSELLRPVLEAVGWPVRAARSRLETWRSRRRGPAHKVVSAADAAVSMETTATGQLDLAGGSAEDQLRKRVGVIEHELAALRTEFRVRAGGFDALFEQAASRIATVDENLRLYRAETHQADLRALPLVGVGILLSSLPEQLVGHQAVGIALLGIGSAAFIWFLSTLPGKG